MRVISGISIILFIVTTFILAACGSFNMHTVRKGETLYSISFHYGQDYKQVAAWNHIDPPYIINPGQIIRVSPPPPGEQKSLVSTEGKAMPMSSSSSGLTEKGSTSEFPAAEREQADKQGSKRIIVSSRQPPPVYPKTVHWQWPVAGDIIQTFSARQPGRKGIDITAARGTPIKAAASGRVVYAGEGLTSYGKLIIIKHNEQFLSAYAHNRKFLVKEGQNVKAGEAIAEMGDSGANKVKLHFEVRRKGKPVDPLKYLPKR